jgi:hypothetical protein
LRHYSALFVIALAGVSGAGAAQSTVDAHAEALTRITDRIVATQALGGPYARELIEPLMDLSLFHQERGDYALELAAIEQALHVVRANYGLRSLEQAPLIRQQIRGEESRGNFAAAWELEQALLTLAQRHPDDLRTAPIFHEIGDKRMGLMSSFLAGERPPQLFLGCFYEAPRQFDDRSNCSAGGRSDAARNMVRDAQRQYASAIAVLRRQQQHASSELHELEDKLLRNSYLLGDYQTGRRSLVRRIYDDAANAEPVLSRVERIVELADWDLLYGQRTLAMDLYVETHEFLVQQGVAQRAIDAIFAPAAPIALPTFEPSLLSAERAQGSTGHVDVAFEVTPFGTTRRIRILGTTRDASKAEEHRLARWVLETHFRPRLAGGELTASRVAMRHFVHE